MCGIIAALATSNVAPVLYAGLQQLEYRGYDSAGIAIATGKKIELARSVGRVHKLASAAKRFHGRAGVGHTRWATHGPSTPSQCPSP